MEKLTKPSEGFFLAKRRTVDGIDARMGKLHEEQKSLVKFSDRWHEINSELTAMESIRNYVRNGLLWDTSEGP